MKDGLLNQSRDVTDFFNDKQNDEILKLNQEMNQLKLGINGC